MFCHQGVSGSSVIKHRMHLALLLSAALSIAGCPLEVLAADGTPLSKESVQTTQANNPYFLGTLRTTLAGRALEANYGYRLAGEIRLQVSINRKNEVVGCEASDKKTDPKLTALAEDICWSSLFPEVPVNYFAPDGIFKVIAPLSFPFLTDHQVKYKNPLFRRYVQGRFFRERTVLKRPPDSIGRANFRYEATPDGRVQKCVVNLEAIEVRQKDFKQDNELQDRLTRECLQMNVREMYGFQVRDGVASGHVSFEYMPWTEASNKH